MSVIFEVRATQIGDLVEQFAQEKMLILFDEVAPKELHDVVVLHTDRSNAGDVQVGDQLVIDGEAFPIYVVGEKANQTMQELGHVTFKFIGEKEDLPGTICVEEKPIPLIKPGSLIQIIRESD